MTFRQFAYKNVTRNFSSYIAFLLSCAFSVMIFFSFAVFAFHPEMQQPMNVGLQRALLVSEYIIFFTSLSFVYYSLGSFIKARNNEFGTLMILGITKRQLNRLVFLENIVIGVLSIVLGLGIGLAFSKLFLMASSSYLSIAELPFYFPVKAIIITVLSFATLFLILSLFTSLFIKHRQIIALLKGSKKPKKEPKANIALVLLSALLLGFGYFLAYTAQGMQVVARFVPVIIIVIIGTYFAYSQLSVFLIKAIKKNKRFYLKGTNMLYISGLAYKIKDNARMLYQVTVTCAVAFTAIATLYSVDSQLINMIRSDQPIAMNYLSLPGNKLEQKHVDGIKKTLDDNNINYESVKTVFYTIDGKSYVGQSQYNKLAKLGNIDTVTALDNAAFILVNTSRDPISARSIPKSIKIGDKINIDNIQVAHPLLPSWNFRDAYVISDKNMELVKSLSKSTINLYSFESDWQKTMAVSDHINKNVVVHMKGDNNSFHSITLGYNSMKQTTNLGLYIGTFIGIIFFITAGSFLYFRLFNDINIEKEKYAAISKIGLSKKEFKKIATMEIALLFFIPYLFATIHTAFAMVPLQNLLSVSILVPSSSVLVVFLILQVIYFLIIRYRYINYLSKRINFE